MVVIRSLYNLGERLPGWAPIGPSKTKQSFFEESLIQNILDRVRAGDTALLDARKGSYGDFSNVPDYRAYQDAINRANDLFGALPALVRRRFDNDPAEFLQFAQDPANGPELIKLGLASEPQKPSAASPAASGAPAATAAGAPAAPATPAPAGGAS